MSRPPDPDFGDSVAPQASSEITTLLHEAGQGDRQAFDQVVELVHDELRLIARRQLRKRWNDSLHTTGLINEAFIKLVRGCSQQWNDRCHFFAVAAMAMRRILVDRAREKLAAKRGHLRDALPLDEAAAGISSDPSVLLDLDAALQRLGAQDEHLARVVDCRFFGGLTFEEMAVALGRHERTLRRDWNRARAWLHRELTVA